MRFADLLRSTAPSRDSETTWFLGLWWSCPFFCVKKCVVLWVSTTCFGSLSLEVTKIYKKSGQVLMTAKAFNGRIIAEWLQRCFQEAMTRGLRDDENLIPLVLSCLKLGNILEIFCQCVLNCCLVSSLGLWTRIDPLTSDSRTALSRFFGIQERQGRFLEPEARADVYKCGMTICRRYIDLAKHAIKYGRDEMRLRPKLHEPSLVQPGEFSMIWVSHVITPPSFQSLNMFVLIAL